MNLKLYHPEKNALRKFNKISKLQKLRNNNNNSITSIDANIQPMSVDHQNNNNNLAELHGSGSGRVMSTYQQRVEQQRRIRSSKVANIPYCVLPQPYNVCRRTTNMNALQMHNYIETLREEYAPGKKSLKGRGLLKTDPNVHELLGSQAPTNNEEYSNSPTMVGTRNLGSAQPGSEKLNFEPIVKIQDAIENVQEMLVPASNRNPGVSDNMIFGSLAQQAGAYMDVKTFEPEYDMQLYKGDNVIVPADEGVPLNFISFINNIAASVIKHFSISINNQTISVESGNYAIADYFETLWMSEQDAEMKGDLRDQGFIYEKPGTLDDCTVTPAAGANRATSRNAKALYYHKALLQGKKVRFRLKPKLCFTGSQTFVSMANKIDYTIVKNDPSFYMQVTPERLHPGTNPEKKTSYDNSMALARQLKLSITDVKLRFKKYELSPKLTEQYISTYTINRPDTFMFTHHEIRTIPINPNANPIQQEIVFDAVPQTIWVTVVDKKALIGTFDSTPFQTYPIPEPTAGAGFELWIKVNNQTWRPTAITNNAEAYRRANEIMFSNMRNPLLTRDSIIANDSRDPDLYDARAGSGTTGYPVYVFVQTMGGKGSDGIFYEDRRSGNIELICQLKPGTVWNANYEWQVHAFSRRNYSIDNIGQISKNFL